MSIEPESPFYVVHVAAATCQDDATQEFFRVFVGDETLHVLYYFPCASLYYVHEFAHLNEPVGVDGIVAGLVDVVAVGKRAGIFEF